MTKNYTSVLGILFSACLLLSGCANKPNTSPEEITEHISQEERKAKLLAKSNWQIKGKIAFIQQLEGKDKRESATIIWRANEKLATQELNLTSYLGINVLQLKSNKHQHLIKVDGEEYRGNDLPLLIYSLTGLVLPTNALSFWLKGLAYKDDDLVKVNVVTQLPTHISSQFEGDNWQIKYDNYRWFDNVQLATKFTIQKEDLLIKIIINKWTFID